VGEVGADASADLAEQRGGIRKTIARKGIFFSIIASEAWVFQDTTPKNIRKPE
jgi:hypothetical protein